MCLEIFLHNQRRIKQFQKKVSIYKDTKKRILTNSKSKRVSLNAIQVLLNEKQKGIIVGVLVKTFGAFRNLF